MLNKENLKNNNQKLKENNSDYLWYYKDLVSNNFNKLSETLNKFKISLNESSHTQKKVIFNIIFFSSLLFTLIVGAELLSSRTQPPQVENVTNQSQISQNALFDKEAIQTTDPSKAIGFDLLDPTNSMFSPVVDAITSMVKQVVGLFDNYVAFTPNIANNDGNIKDASNNNLNIGVDKFYDVITKIAWLILPLLIMINGVMIAMEGSFKGRILLSEIAKKIMIFVIGMVAFRFILSIGITLINDIDLIVIKGLIGNNGSVSLSTAILSALGVNPNDPTLGLKDQGGFNIVSQAIIWLGLFFFLIMLMYQFIIRFFHLWLHAVLYPIELVVGLLPGGGQIFKSYVEEIIRTLAVQPVFLVGLGMIITIIGSGTGSVTKIMLGIGALSFLNTIPSIVNRFSGVMWAIAGTANAGIVGMATVGQARFIKRAVTSGMTGERSGSLRAWAGKSFGEALVGRSNIDNPNFNPNIQKKSTVATSAISQGFGKSFSDLIKGGTNATTAFEAIGMKPLNGLKSEGGKTLFSNKADFSYISEISAKDGSTLQNSFGKNNFGSFYSDTPVTLPQVTDLSKFNAVHTNTQKSIPTVMSSTQKSVRLGKTFDSTNSDQWNHLSDWYSKTNAGNRHPVDLKTYVANPIHRHEIINTGLNQGYFQAQKIKTIKVQDQFKDQAPVTKYYPVKPINKSNPNNK